MGWSNTEGREMRMKRLYVFILGLVTMVLCVNGQSISGEKRKMICAPLGTMLLKPPPTVEAQRPPVKFSHTEHLLLYSCKSCHHTWEGEARISNCTASGCHGTKKPEKKERRMGRTWLDFSPEEIKYYKNAYHRQCIVCHKEIKLRNIALMEQAQGEKKPELGQRGPTKCNQCHVDE
jgi:hypothetical protein